MYWLIWLSVVEPVSFSLLRIAQFDGSLRFGQFNDRFKSCYELLRPVYVLLRKIYKYRKSQCIIIRQLTSRETTWHMRETDCSYINEVFGFAVFI